MSATKRTAPLLAILAVACSPRPNAQHAKESSDLRPAAEPTTVEATELPDLVPIAVPEALRTAPAQRRRTDRRVTAIEKFTRLPAPSGLTEMRFDSPLVLVHPVVWDGAHAAATSNGSTQAEPVLAFVDATVVEAIDLAAARIRIDSQEQTLAELAQIRAAMSQTLRQLRGIIPVLAGRQRLQAGLRACALRRDLEEIAETHRALHHDLYAAREQVAPAVRLASGTY